MKLFHDEAATPDSDRDLMQETNFLSALPLTSSWMTDGSITLKMY